MDRTAYLKSNRKIRGVAIAAVSDMKVLERALQETRKALHLPADKAFHAYDDSPDVQYYLLQSVLSTGMTIQIGAMFYDTDEDWQENIECLSEVEFIYQSALALLDDFLPLYPLNMLVSDRDLEGKKQEERFKKSVRALCRTQQIPSPRIGFCTAHENKSGSELVQFADAIVYNLYRLRREVLEPPLRQLLKSVAQDSHNVIKNFADWELRED